MGGAALNAVVDTNVLVRAFVKDELAQAAAAETLLREAPVIAISTQCFCEFVWVLRSAYRIKGTEIAGAIEALLGVEAVRVDREAVEAGLAMLRAGGDFADGVIAHEGRWLGGRTFVSFDKRAVGLLIERGVEARLLG